ncbi:MAG: glycosyltransferase [Bacteroidota bacterium]|nr:glycosyltransferase [Bacteroidota bacterium]
MKILLVGSNLSMAIERHYSKYLREMGADIHHYAAPDAVIEFVRKGIVNKVLFKAGVHSLYRQINREVKEIAASFKPDIIWVVKGMELYPETIQYLSARFKTANYNPDHPFIIVSRGSGNRNVTESVPFYHLHFCYNGKLAEEIHNRFGIRTVFLPFAYELSAAGFREAAAENEINKLCFLGNPDSTRENTIGSLASQGFAIDVYGHGWTKRKLAGLSNVKVHDAVYGQAFWNRLRQYRVQLNIFRAHNEGSHNMRSFEIPAVGGIQLAPYSQEQENFFESSRETIYYKGIHELSEKAAMLLSWDSLRANELRVAARERSLTPGYTYADRAATVFGTFKEMMQW